MRLVQLLLRVTLGGLFIGHGTQKLKGWFGGHGLDATTDMFEQLGLRPGRRNAIASGVAEAGGGAAMTLGLATPFAAASLIGSMFTAIHRVHIKNGPWLANQGYEYNLILILAAALIAELGPGPVSVDHLLGTEKSGPAWGLAALAMGGAGSVVVHQLAQAAAPAEPTSQETVGTPVAAEAPAETADAPTETAEATQPTPAQ
jgi:putative oxidoreductase